MAINNMTYKNGKIYCIRNSVDDDIYVGSTTQPLCKRMAMHRITLKIKQHYKLYMKEKSSCTTIPKRICLKKFSVKMIMKYTNFCARMKPAFILSAGKNLKHYSTVCSAGNC